MATKYQYLIDPLLGFQTKSGSLNTAGILRVYDAATDDPAVTYKDFAGTENTQDIRLDDNGRAVVICDDARAYRVEVCDRYGSLLYTQSPLYAKGGGGGVMTGVEVTSDDGTVRVETTTDGGIKKFDLSVVDPSDPEYITCNSYYVKGYGAAGCGYIVPQGKVEGNMDVDGEGILLKAGCHYHVDAWLNAVADAENSDPSNAYRTREMLLNFRLGAADATPVSLTFDNSFYHKDSYNLSGDIHPTNDTYLKLYFDNYEWSNYNSSYISSSHIELPRITVHSIVGAYGGGLESVYHDLTLTGTGTPDDLLGVADGSIGTAQLRPEINDILDEAQLPSDWEASSGVQQILNKPDLSVFATKSELSEGLADKQDVLTAGDHISITNNVISASVPEQVNADWESNSGKSEILHKPDLSVYATKTEVSEGLADKQDTLTPGSNITIENNVISATAEPQKNADWNANSGVQEILNKPDLSVYATKEEVSEDLEGYQEKLTAGDNITIEGNVISAAASEQVNADWLSNSGKSEILNKPDLSVYATKTEVAEDLAEYQPLLTAGDNISITNNVISAADQLNADWEATSGVQEILNKPIVRNLIPGNNITMEDSANGVVISATAVPQVNADWDASSGVSAILNKPDLSVYATETELTTGLAGKQDNMVVLEYGTSTWSDFTTAYNKNAIVYCRVSIGTNQYRLAFMAYRYNTWVEFQYVRSISTHDATNQGDQVFVYKLDSTNTWTTTTREMVLQAKAGNGITRTVSTSSGAGSISWSVKAKANGGVTVDSKGVSVTNPVPSYDSSDADKVLGVVSDGVTTALQWVQGGGGGGGGGSYSAGEGITILGEEISVKAGTGLGFDSNTEELVVNVPVPEPTAADETKVLGVTDANGTIDWVDATPAQVNADWNANSGVAQILNKPDLAQYATYTDLMFKQDVLTPGSHISIQNNVISTDLLPQVNSDWDADSGVAEILNKPDIKPIVAGTGILITEGANAVTVEATGGSYTAGDGIAISDSEISVNYDSDTLDTVAGTVTITAASTPGYYDPFMPINDAGFISLLNGQTSADVTVHIPEGFFVSSPILGEQGYTVFLALYTDDPRYGGTGSPAVYTYAPLTYQYDSLNDEYVIDEQDVVLRLPPSGERWYPGTSLTFTNPYIVIVIAMDPNEGTSTPAGYIADEDPSCTITYTSAASQALTVKNPLPASTVADSSKVLTVNASGTPEWETAANPQVNSDWEATSGVAEILNKPDLVDIVAGPGIVVDNPDGNTLRVSSEYDVETVLFEDTGTTGTVVASVVLSEAASHFSTVEITLGWAGGGSTPTAGRLLFRCKPDGNYYGFGGFIGADASNHFVLGGISANSTTIGLKNVIDMYSSNLTAVTYQSFNNVLKVFKVVGINRIAGGN